jgi:hypothetical protein
MRVAALLLTTAVAAASPGARAEPFVLLFDARAFAVPAQLSAAEAALLERVVRPQARAAWRGADACTDAFAVVGRARGAFTRPGARQSAVLYRFCETGRQTGMSGVAVLEPGRVAAHMVFEGGGEDAVAALPDVDGNGLSEIAIASAGSGQGYMEGGVAVVELGASGVRKLGAFVTYRNNCGSEERRLAERASVLHGTPGPTPRFFIEGFTKPCEGPGRWRRASARVPVRPERDETAYRRLR